MWGARRLFVSHISDTTSTTLILPKIIKYSTEILISILPRLLDCMPSFITHSACLKFGLLEGRGRSMYKLVSAYGKHMRTYKRDADNLYCHVHRLARFPLKLSPNATLCSSPLLVYNTCALNYVTRLAILFVFAACPKYVA